MKKRIIITFILIILVVFQFVGIIPSVYAEESQVGEYTLTTDSNGLIGYGFADGNYIFGDKSAFYVYGRFDKNSRWVSLAYNSDDCNGWNYGFLADDDFKSYSIMPSADNTEVYDELTGLHSKLNFSFHNEGKILKITYTIINKSDSTKKFGLWSGGDTELDEEDGVPINEFTQNGIKGFYMSNSSAQFNVFSTTNDNDIDFWSGNFQHFTSSYTDPLAMYSILVGENQDVANDSVAFWHWENQTIPAHSSKEYSIYIGVTTNGGLDIINNITNNIVNEETGIAGITKVQPETPNTNNAKIEDSEKELAQKIPITEEEQAEIDAGKNLSIYLEVKDISNTVAENDKSTISNSLDKNDKIGMYLDVNLYKKLDEAEATKITELNSPIKISFEIPESLINNDININRTYTIYLLHNGEISKKDVTVNGNIGTFETDRFSTYLLTYNDTPATNNPKTGDNIFIYMILAIISIVGLITTNFYIKKKSCK